MVLITYATTKDTFAVIERFPDEKYFIDPDQHNEKCPFPFMVQEPSIDLSLVVPSYNEQDRCEYEMCEVRPVCAVLVLQG